MLEACLEGLPAVGVLVDVMNGWTAQVKPVQVLVAASIRGHGCGVRGPTLRLGEQRRGSAGVGVVVRVTVSGFRRLVGAVCVVFMGGWVAWLVGVVVGVAHGGR